MERQIYQGNIRWEGWKWTNSEKSVFSSLHAQLTHQSGVTGCTFIFVKFILEAHMSQTHGILREINCKISIGTYQSSYIVNSFKMLF